MNAVNCWEKVAKLMQYLDNQGAKTVAKGIKLMKILSFLLPFRELTYLSFGRGKSSSQLPCLCFYFFSWGIAI